MRKKFSSQMSSPQKVTFPEPRMLGTFSKGLFTNYVSQKWGVKTPLPPLSAIVNISSTTPPHFVSHFVTMRIKGFLFKCNLFKK